MSKRAAKKTNAKGARPKNVTLPGVKEKIPALERLAEVYVEKRDQRQAWGAEEVEAKKKMLELMTKLAIKIYRSEHVEAIRTTEKEKLTVRIVDEDED